MGLSNIRLRDVVLPFSQKCGISNLTPDQISGVNCEKEFFEPSHQIGEETSQYKIVPPKHFACNLMHVGRDRVLPIAFNHSDHNKVVSPAYTVFSIKENNEIIDEYFFLMLKSNERDRFFWFHADSSIRDGMPWSEFCNLELTVPDLPTQQKYVDIYNAMVANQQSYERGLEDMRLVIEGHFDESKKKDTLPLRDIIEKFDERNIDLLYQSKDVRGINNTKEFAETKADITDVDLSKFKIVKPGYFAYNSRTDGRDMLVLALNRLADPVIVTFNYNVFRIRPQCEIKVNAEYLYSFFKRSEFDRRVRFNSWGSSQELLTWDNLGDIRVPIPDLHEQIAIARINQLYIKRWQINEQLKAQIKNICPVLIKGSLEEVND